MTGTARRHPAWVAAVAVCLVVLLGLFAEVGRRSWSELNGEVGQARSERQGVRYLHGVITLVGDLVKAQSTAVRGKAIDKAGLAKAVQAVAVVDAEIGDALGVRQRFAGLRTKVEAAIASPVTGRAAYLAYTDVVALAVDLLHRVGSNSDLVHQETADSYHLMDAVLFKLPDAIVLAGRTADLVTLAGDRPLTGEDSIRAAVARFGVATASEEVTAGLNTSVDTTERTSLGSNIAVPLDAFRSAVDAFAPPTMVAQLAGSIDPATLASGAQAVFATALLLTHRLLTELDGVLAAWEDDLVGQRTFVTVAAGAAGVTLILVIFLWLARPRAARTGRDSADGRAGEDVVDVRRLFDAEELAAVGAAAAARSSRGRGDAG